MWIALSILSALLLGFYDVAKKNALRRNDVMWVLLVSCAMTTVLLSPWLKPGPASYHLQLAVKAALVTASWIGGLVGMKYLPLTTVSSIKASRPMFVVLFSLILFSEKLNLWQWAGVIGVLCAIFLLSRSSSAEGIDFRHNKGIWAMAISVFAGVASALFDKHVMESMEPLFVQSWSNFYITLMLLAILGVQFLLGRCGKRDAVKGLRWDWWLPVIAVLITGADFLYFYALSLEGSLLSVVSIVRRCSVIVVFLCGAFIFKEHHIKEKAGILALMIASVLLLMVGSL